MKILIYLFLFFPLLVYSQQIFDFEDSIQGKGEEIPPGRWAVSDDDPLVGVYSLHHSFDNPEAGTDVVCFNLSYPDLQDTIAYSFYIRHGYNPSSGNNWQVFVHMQEKPGAFPAEFSPTGMAIGVNLNASDDRVKLWQLENGMASEVIASQLNYQEIIGPAGIPEFRILRYPDGRWVMDYRLPLVDSTWISLGEGREQEPIGGKYACLRYSYSSAQDRKLWFDNYIAKGDFYTDTSPPNVLSAEVAGPGQLQIGFNEPVGLTDSSRVYCTGNRLDSLRISGQFMDLYFSYGFPNRQSFSVSLLNLTDMENNVLGDTIVSCFQNHVVFGDIVFTEMMADPDPPVYLPVCEYLEIFNRSEYDIVNQNWTLKVNDRSYALNDLTLPVGAFMILCPDDEACTFEGVEYTSHIPASSFLPNSGADIRLMDGYDRLIALFSYPDAAVFGNITGEGGRSLEIMDPGLLCQGRADLAPSADPRGGTPGAINSQLQDLQDEEKPLIEYAGISGDSIFTLHFTEPVLIPDKVDIHCLKGGVYLPVQPEEDYSIVKNLDFTVPPGSASMVEVEIKRLTDCNGNKTPTASFSFDFPVLPGEHSSLINEIMYDPLEGNSPYIELLNTSAEFINLYDLALRISGSDGEEGKVVLLCGSSRLLAPGACIALCPDALNLRDEWNLGWEIQVLEVQDWKALSTSGGCVRLEDRSGNLIDGFCYNDSLHNDLIADPKGIALERACHGSYECWTSAAFSAGNGTPGQKNSQYFDPIVSEKQVSIHHRVFSPDGDGIDDLLFIEISGITVETAMEILVTDLPGNIVRNLAALSVGGETNVFCWDGRDNYGKMSYPGIYTIHIRIVSKQENMVFREICAVRYR